MPKLVTTPLTFIFLFSFLPLLNYAAEGHKVKKQNPRQLRIMPVGDSITVGYTDNPEWTVPFNFGYRGKLYQLLKAAAVDFVFVGDSKEPYNNRFGDPSHGGTVKPQFDLRQTGQDKHQGYGGQKTPELTKNIAAWLKKERPNVILLLTGINGVIQPQLPEMLRSAVAQIYATDPKVTLIVAQITPLAQYSKPLEDYNTFIRDTLLPEYKQKGYDFLTVDLYTMFLKNPADKTSIDPERLSNGINHPDEQAYEKMALEWFKVLRQRFEF